MNNGEANLWKRGVYLLFSQNLVLRIRAESVCSAVNIILIKGTEAQRHKGTK
jgi:hypothetical protein